MPRLIATIATFFVCWMLTPAVWAECPDGYECLSEDPTHCLSAEQLEAHEEDLADCRQTTDELRGRVESLRDQIAPLQARVEKLAAEKAKMQVERDQAREALEQRASPLSWLSYGVCGGAGGAGAVQIVTADGPGDLWRGGGTAAIGVAGCVLGRLLR